MKKYIDADKLTKNFEKMIDDIPASVDSGAGYVIDEVYKIIDTLQQEQPDVDIEKEIIRYQREDMDRDTTVGDVARHFYELGIDAGKKK